MLISLNLLFIMPLYCQVHCAHDEWQCIQNEYIQFKIHTTGFCGLFYSSFTQVKIQELCVWKRGKVKPSATELWDKYISFCFFGCNYKWNFSNENKSHFSPFDCFTCWRMPFKLGDMIERCTMSERCTSEV